MCLDKCAIDSVQACSFVDLLYESFCENETISAWNHSGILVKPRGSSLSLTLRITVRHCDACGFTVLVDSGPEDDSPNRIPVLDGSVEWLQDEDATTLTSAETSSSFVESDRPSRVRQQPSVKSFCELPGPQCMNECRQKAIQSLENEPGVPLCTYRPVEKEMKESGIMFK